MISSRTPDGQFHLCPVCGNELCIDPSTLPMRDAPCPHCGSLLDFVDALPLRDSRVWQSQSYEELLVTAGESHLGIISTELVANLRQLLAELSAEDRLPPRDQAIRWVQESTHWSQLFNRLEAWQPGSRRRSVLTSAREFFTRRRRRTRVKS